MLDVVLLNLNVARFGFLTDTSAVIDILDGPTGRKPDPPLVVVLRLTLRVMLLSVMIGSFTLKIVNMSSTMMVMMIIMSNNVHMAHNIERVQHLGLMDRVGVGSWVGLASGRAWSSITMAG
ncbi:hypothetical protein BVRB_1g003930 [Beta vulgaris subsp. vulgaris]|nr:hypothetical protein BVRB_1g003930 [Beta vulgaris subsp. vulgaris]